MGEVVFYYSTRTVFIFLVLLRYLPFMIEILLDRPVQEVNFMNYVRGKLARFANKIMSTNSNWRTLILSNLRKNRWCFLNKYSVFRYYQLSFNIISRYQTPLAKTWYFQNILCCLRQSRDLVQSTTKVHHPQLFVRTKIYSPYSISVATSYIVGPPKT